MTTINFSELSTAQTNMQVYEFDSNADQGIAITFNDFLSAMRSGNLVIVHTPDGSYYYPQYIDKENYSVSFEEHINMGASASDSYLGAAAV